MPAHEKVVPYLENSLLFNFINLKKEEKCEVDNCDKQIKQFRDCVDDMGMIADDCRGNTEELKDCRCSDFATTTGVVLDDFWKIELGLIFEQYCRLGGVLFR